MLSVVMQKNKLLSSYLPTMESECTCVSAVDSILLYPDLSGWWWLCGAVVDVVLSKILSHSLLLPLASYEEQTV